MTSITALFFDLPGSATDKVCHGIFETYGGEFVGAGTLLASGERDVQYFVPNDRAEECRATLKKAGFRLQSQIDIGELLE
jgi:hypothetical protein